MSTTDLTICISTMREALELIAGKREIYPGAGPLGEKFNQRIAEMALEKVDYLAKEAA